jgi:hypothetical protein
MELYHSLGLEDLREGHNTGKGTTPTDPTRDAGLSGPIGANIVVPASRAPPFP